PEAAMKVFAATTIIFGLLFSALVLSLPSVGEARELPPRAISADATCQIGEVNGHAGFICRDGSVNYFCTEPRTVCWPIVPPGPYSRGSRNSLVAAAQPVQTRAAQ
ncbi:MAG: hypothetical protein ACREH4_06010, partial [Vitreimonas sp.]